MLITKDYKGKVYVAKVSPPVDRYTPGVVGEWFFLGPGEDVSISRVSGNLYLITFKYLASNFVRVLDSNVWPPLQVDPVTSYNPITIQRPESWIPSDPVASPAVGVQGMPPERVSVVREDPYIRWDYTTGIFTLTLKRDTTTTPPNCDKYRLYRRAIGATEWELLVDWVDELSTIKVQDTKRPMWEFRATWGNLWADGYQNYPRGTHPQEHLPGPVLRVDSSKEPCVINLECSEAYSRWSREHDAAQGFMTSNPSYQFLAASDTVSALTTRDGDVASSWYIETYSYENSSVEERVSVTSWALSSDVAMGF